MDLATALPHWLQAMEIRVEPALDDLPAPVARGILWQATREKFLLDIPHFGRVIASRNEIRVCPQMTAQWTRFAPFLRATPLAAVTLLRGGFACNGAAVAGPDGAVLLMGESAVGKSALALALMKRGLRLMADDAAPVFSGDDGRAFVYPVWPQMRLWPDTVDAILACGLPQWLLPAPQQDDGPPYWDIADQVLETRPMPLRAIYDIRWNRRLQQVRFSAGPRGFERLSSGVLIPYHAKISAALMPPETLLRIYAATGATTSRYIDMPQRGLTEVECAADQILQECGWLITI